MIDVFKVPIEIRSTVYVISHFIFQEHRFTTMPHKIRCAPAVNSFFSNMSQVSTILIGIFVRSKLLHINKLELFPQVNYKMKFLFRCWIATM